MYIIKVLPFFNADASTILYGWMNIKKIIFLVFFLKLNETITAVKRENIKLKSHIFTQFLHMRQLNEPEYLSIASQRKCCCAGAHLPTFRIAFMKICTQRHNKWTHVVCSVFISLYRTKQAKSSQTHNI